jgi:segregation and condensation protein B
MLEDHGTTPDKGNLPEAASSLFDPKALDAADKRALFAALLFSTGEVVSADRIAEFLELEPAALAVEAEELAGELRPLGLDVLAAAGGFKLVTSAQWDSFLAAFHRQERKARLSRSALEVLAIVAYEQPASRSKIDELRQVASDSTLRTLLDRRLLTVAGREEGPGRPFLYRTTAHFLELFGLNSLDDLPPRPASFAAVPQDRDDAPPGLDELPNLAEEDE